MTDDPKIRPYRRHLLVCTGPRCTQGESRVLWESLGPKFAAVGLDVNESLRVKRTRCECFAVCKAGPILCVQPDGIWYHHVTDEVLDRIIREHLLGGKPVEEFIFHRQEVPVA